MNPTTRQSMTALLSVMLLLNLMPAPSVAQNSASGRVDAATKASRRGGQPARANEPGAPSNDDRFSNVTDILGGRRHLLRVDDLAVTAGFTDNALYTYMVKTQNSSTGTVTQVWANYFGDPPFTTRVGRMFNLPYDTTVAIAGNAPCDIDDRLVNCSNVVFPTEGVADTGFNTGLTGNLLHDVGTMADFTGDGFADFAFVQAGQPYIATAKDVNNPSAGVTISSAGIPFYAISDTTPAAMAAGDLDGDGTTELVLAYPSWGAVWDNNAHVVVDVFDVQVVNQGGILLSRAGSTDSEITLVEFAFPSQIGVTAGNYSGEVNTSTALPEEDIVVAYSYSNSGWANPQVDANTIRVTTQNTNPLQFSLAVANQANLITTGIEVELKGMVSERLSFYGSTEQVVVGMYVPGYDSYLSILTFDEQLNISQPTSPNKAPYTFASGVTLADVAVGNFDQTLDASQPLNLQIAAVTIEGGNVGLYLFNVDPTNSYAITQYQHTTVASGDQTPFGFADVELAAGDLQGRSLLLGEPTRITAQHIQPEIVLGMPPMHVDWVTSAGGTAPEILNLSAVPDGYYSSYQTTATNTTQSSRKSTTSFSHSLSEELDQKLKLGVPDVASVSGEFKYSASQTWQNSVENTYGQYDSTSFDASSQTGFDDQLWYNSERQNIYVYPVIGQKGCPEGQPNCSDSQKLPLNVMFSGPDQRLQTSIGGAAVEWYQPVREPGNIFSYPWSLTQLQQLEPNLNLLTSNTPTQFFTDGSIRKEQANWQNQTSQGSTTGSDQKYTWGRSSSLSSDISVLGFIGGSFNLTLAYNGSKSISTLNSKTTTLGQSTGIGVQKPGSFANPGEYQYAVSPFIFGENPVAGALQTINLGTDVQTNGILRTEFVANPTDPNAGPWWQTAYTRPDVALNHPARWEVTKPALTDPLPPNCRPTGTGSSQMNCITFNQPDANVWLSEFHWMKGLFITPAEANGEGPQLSQATAGDQLVLGARVYNYSLTDMPPGSEVIVRFYGQPWDSNTLRPAGDAFLIDTVGLGPIPGFNSNSTGGTQPNWAIASTNKLDTAAYGDQFLAFWVVVWTQDGNGNLIAEMPDHGLKGIPGTLTKVNDATPLLESYSNNIGFYKSLFYVAPQGQSTATSVAAGANNRATSLEQVTLEQVTVERKHALLDEKVSVSAVLRAGDRAVNGTSVIFYDGDPNNGGKAFDHETISHIRANETHRVMVPFKADACGVHTIYVRLHPHAQTASATLDVRIRPLPVVRELTRQTRALELPARDKRYLLDLLRDARQAFRRLDVRGALSKLDEYREKIEAMRGGAIPAEQADLILAHLNQISSCVGFRYDISTEELIEDNATDAELVGPDRNHRRRS